MLAPPFWEVGSRRGGGAALLEGAVRGWSAVTSNTFELLLSSPADGTHVHHELHRLSCSHAVPGPSRISTFSFPSVVAELRAVVLLQNTSLPRPAEQKNVLVTHGQHLQLRKKLTNADGAVG